MSIFDRSGVKRTELLTALELSRRTCVLPRYITRVAMQIPGSYRVDGRVWMFPESAIRWINKHLSDFRWRTKK